MGTKKHADGSTSTYCDFCGEFFASGEREGMEVKGREEILCPVCRKSVVAKQHILTPDLPVSMLQLARDQNAGFMMLLNRVSGLNTGLFG